jgi:hypothetical protein
MYSDAPTSVAHPYTITNNKFNLSSLPTHLLDLSMWPGDGQYLVATSRNPLQASVTYVPNPLGLLWSYQMYFGGSNYGQSFIDHGFSDKLTLLANTKAVVTKVRPMYFQAGADSPTYGPSTYLPGGPAPYFPGTHGDRMGMWIDGCSRAGTDPAFATIAEFKVQVSTGGNIPSGTYFDIICHMLVGDIWVQDTYNQIVGNGVVLGGNIEIRKPGYYAFDVACYDPGASTLWDISVTLSGYGPNMVHSAVPGLWEKRDSVTATRVLAVSSMVSCQAPLLTTSGRVAGVQLPPGSSFVQYMPVDGFDEIATSATAYNGDFKKGIYSFIKPRNAEDLRMRAIFTEASDSTVNGINCELVPIGGWLVQKATVLADNTSGLYNGAAAYTTLAFSVEFATTDTWFLAVVPKLTADQMASAMELVKRCPQHHENPMHFSDVLRFLKGATKGALSLAPTLAKAVSAFAPEFAGVANGAAGLATAINDIWD